MSRFLYWTIVLGKEPTSFRASDPGELLPTLAQLRRKHPEAALMWFQRGRLWTSPDEAKASLGRERDDARKRPATWRPGGKHEDPRQKFLDAKKAKWTRFKSAIRERAEARRSRDDAPADRDRPQGDRPERPRFDRPRDERPRGDRPRADRPRDDRPPEDRPPRPDWRTLDRGDKPAFRDRKPPFDRGDKPAFRDRKPAFD